MSGRQTRQRVEAEYEETVPEFDVSGDETGHMSIAFCDYNTSCYSFY